MKDTRPSDSKRAKNINLGEQVRGGGGKHGGVKENVGGVFGDNM